VTIRGLLLAKMAGFGLGWLLRPWVGSLYVSYEILGVRAIPRAPAVPVIYVLWHEVLMLPATRHARVAMPIISRSFDGEVAFRLVRSLRGHAIRGSTDHHGKYRGGWSVLCEILERGKNASIAVVLDGPVGPSRRASRGAVVLAARTGMPVVPVGIGYSACRHVGHPDRRMALPFPFCRAVVVIGKPLCPAGEDLRSDLHRLQVAMDETQARAESLARR